MDKTYTVELTEKEITEIYLLAMESRSEDRSISKKMAEALDQILNESM